MSKKSKTIIVLISLFVGLLHFVVGPNYNGPLQGFVSGYLIDLLLPFNLYLLSQIPLRKIMTPKSSRGLAVCSIFIFGALVETLQYYKISFLGNTFDPLDLLMYGIGVLSGLAFDLLVLDKKIEGHP